MTESERSVATTDAQSNVYLVISTVVGSGVGIIWGYLLGGIGGALVGAVFMAIVARFVVRVMVVGTSNAAANLLVPDARGGVGTTYSHIAAREVKGDIAGALEAWEEAIAASPDAVAARLNAAELYTRKGNNHARAAELYRDVRNHPDATDEMRRYTSQRLIDLYLGPLKDEGRALVELRKVADQWPGTREGEGARQAIAKIKNL